MKPKKYNRLDFTDLTLERIIYCVEAELRFARKNFPSNDKLLAAFNEEAGELTKAMLDSYTGKGPDSDVFNEAVQVIAMAVRLVQEGDPDFKYKPDYQHYTKWGRE